MAKSTPTAPEPGLPPWLAAMRQAAQDALRSEDLQAIVRKQVELAKGGDRDAAKFIFDYVAGAGQFRGATFVQNVFPGQSAEDPAQPTRARPGTKAKVDVMAKRRAAGMLLTNPNDGPPVNLD